MKSIRLTRAAQRDIDQVWSFVAMGAGSTDVADRFVDELRGQIRALGVAPHAGVLRSDLEKGVRMIPFEDYVIYYRLSSRGLTIRRVIHGKRDQSQVWS